MFENDVTARISVFLISIGISVRAHSVSQAAFLPGIELRKGELLVDEACLQYPGDLLHEAAHIAVTPSIDRVNLGPGGLEEPGLEIAALAWSYAACVHLEMPPELVFHAGGYKGASGQIIDTFRSGRTLGQPLLAWMGMTAWPPAVDPEASFPVMRKWLRD